MSPAVLSFEVLRFEAVPAAAGLAVLELDGRFAEAVPARPPRLLVESAAGSTELPAVELVPEPWSATFAVSLDALADPDAAFALVPGRGPLIGLPAPSLVTADDDRFVRLARTVNDLRHKLSEATARAADADRLRGDLGQARARLAELERRAAAAERDAESARAEHDRAVADAEDRVAEAVGAAEEASAALARATAEIAALSDRAQSAERNALQLRDAADAARREVVQERAAASSAQAELDEARDAAAHAEEDAQSARHELSELRTRLEALERERGRAGAATAEPADADADADASAAPAAALRWDRDEPTEPVEPLGSAEPTRTLDLAADDLAAGPPEDEPEDTVRVLRPRSSAAGDGSPVRAVDGEPVDDEPAGDEDDDATADDVLLPPAGVGARHLEPSTTHPSGLTPARIMVGAAVLLLFLALVLIFTGSI